MSDEKSEQYLESRVQMSMRVILVAQDTVVFIDDARPHTTIIIFGYSSKSWTAVPCLFFSVLMGALGLSRFRWRPALHLFSAKSKDFSAMGEQLGD